MKPILTGLALLLATSAFALPVEYKTLHLVSWAYQCSLRLAPTYQLQGMTSNLAMQSAIQLCSCVIDHYRENHRYVDLQLMPLPQREAFGEMYSQECIDYPERNLMEFVDHSTHFSRDELKCKFTGECSMSSSFLTKLETLRQHYGKPIRLTSAYRSLDHPVERAKNKNGSTSTGYHVLGRAVDIACWNADGARLLEIGIQMGLFGGYGFSFTGSSRFLHVDDREDGLMIWSY